MGVVTHGYSRTPTYNTWANMIGRCTNSNRPDYARYGGSGICVCERWLSFENFLHDMGEKPEGLSIDRINPSGNYEPNNCRWATQEQQDNNKRTTLWVVLNGEAMSAKIAATNLQIPYERIRWAIQEYGADWYAYATSPSSGVLQRNNATGFRGVSVHKASGLFHARIEKNKVRKSLGYFKTAKEANDAVVRAAAAIGKEMK